MQAAQIGRRENPVSFSFIRYSSIVPKRPLKASLLPLQHSLSINNSSCLLLRELDISNLIPPQYHIEDPLHCAQQLLVRRGGTPLKVCDYRRRGIALGSQILLGHGGTLVVLRFATGFLNGVANAGAHGFRLDNLVGSIDFCEVLSFDSRFRGLVNVSVSTSFEVLSPVPETTPLPAPLLPPFHRPSSCSHFTFGSRRWLQSEWGGLGKSVQSWRVYSTPVEWGVATNRIPCLKLLLGCDDRAAPLCRIQRTLASHNGFTGT